MDRLPFAFVDGRVLIDRHFQFHRQLLEAVLIAHAEGFDAWIRKADVQLGIAWAEGKQLHSFQLWAKDPSAFANRDEHEASPEQWQRDETSLEVLSACEVALRAALAEAE